MESESWVLVVDDDRHNREMLGEALRRAGFHVALASGVMAALETAGGRDFDAIMSDIKMSPLSGMDLLQRFRDSSPETPVVLLSAFGSLETAIQAMNEPPPPLVTSSMERLTRLIEKAESVLHEDLPVETFALTSPIAAQLEQEEYNGGTPNG